MVSQVSRFLGNPAKLRKALKVCKLEAAESGTLP
jgi:hypothetical protein